MLHSVDCFFAWESRHSARHHHNIVAAFNEFGGQTKPYFLHAAAHRRRDRKERAQDNRDFHCAIGTSSRICKSESTARLISKRRSKQFRAFSRIASRSAGGVSIQR